MRVPKGLLHCFRASRVPLGIDHMGFVSRKHWEITKIPEINENGANALPSSFWTSWFALGPLVVDYRKPSRQIVFFTLMHAFRLLKNTNLKWDQDLPRNFRDPSVNTLNTVFRSAIQFRPLTEYPTFLWGTNRWFSGKLLIGSLWNFRSVSIHDSRQPIKTSSSIWLTVFENREGSTTSVRRKENNLSFGKAYKSNMRPHWCFSNFKKIQHFKIIFWRD